MRYLLYIALLVTTAEAVQWGVAIGGHAAWMRHNRKFMACQYLNCKAVLIGAILTSLLSISVATTVLVLTQLSVDHVAICAFMALGVQLSHIHLLAFIARCIEFPVELWPWLSKVVSTKLINKPKCSGLQP